MPNPPRRQKTAGWSSCDHEYDALYNDDCDEDVEYNDVCDKVDLHQNDEYLYNYDFEQFFIDGLQVED